MQGTDNSHLDIKAQLRCDHIPDDDIKVLDAYGGHGKVWQEVIKKTGRQNITRLGIDKENRPNCLKGDNRKWMKGMDLSKFNVIDLDAYGVPFDQCKILFEKQFKGVVFFTFIQSVMGKVPVRLLYENGISRDMKNQCPTIFGQMGWALWKDWLANNGVAKLHHYTLSRKHYGCYVIE